MRSLQTALLVAAFSIVAAAQTSWSPAQFREGTLPSSPGQAVAGGEVFVQATVTSAGLIGEVSMLRTSATFAPNVLSAIRGWQLQPAEQRVPAAPGAPRGVVTEAVESKVLIACVFRPPTLNTPTVGDPPKDVGTADDDVAFPMKTVTPLYPPLASADASVLVQVTVAVDGSAAAATIVRSAPAFDASALSAARGWKFRPARIHGRLEETFAYLIFVFRQPVTSPAPR